MSRRAVYHLEYRFLVSTETLVQFRSRCSVSSKTVWLTTSERYRIHTLVGVPGNKLDLLLPDYEPVTIAVEIGRKAGCYDGAVRWRIAFREWTGAVSQRGEPTTGLPGPGRLLLEEAPEGGVAVIAMYGQGSLWVMHFDQLQSVPEPGQREPILLWHWKRYFSFLPEEDVRQLAVYWSLLPHTVCATDLVVLNRSASSALYDLARQSGWRKLTIREKKRLRLALDGPQWQRTDAVSRRFESLTGAGEYTIRAANGEQDYVRTSHGVIDVE